MTNKDPKAVNAVAEAWASIDGKLDPYRAESHGEIRTDEPGFTGHYLGYQAEAEEMITRLRRRGFDVVPLPTTQQGKDA